jgi:hypothetical protein
VYWGGRQSGKTTKLIENIGWATGYIGTQWKYVKRLYAGVNCQPPLQGVSVPQVSILLLDDIENWRLPDALYMVGQALENDIETYITFTPPPYHVPKTHWLVGLARMDCAKWLGSAAQSIPKKELERYKQELPKWHYKTQMEGKLLLGADTNRL